MIEGRLERIKRLGAVLHNLTNDQLSLIERIAYQFLQPFTLIESLSSSDIINDCLLTTFGDVLRIHHCFSKESLSKVGSFQHKYYSTINLRWIPENRRTAMFAYSGFNSMPTNWRLCSTQTSATVPVPIKGSKIIECGGDPACKHRVTRSGGNTAKCAPEKPRVLIGQTDLRFREAVPFAVLSLIASKS